MLIAFVLCKNQLQRDSKECNVRNNHFDYFLFTHAISYLSSCFECLSCSINYKHNIVSDEEGIRTHACRAHGLLSYHWCIWMIVWHHWMKYIRTFLFNSRTNKQNYLNHNARQWLVQVSLPLISVIHFTLLCVTVVKAPLKAWTLLASPVQ